MLVIAQLPWFEQGILDVDIVGRTGATPYVRWGDTLVVAFAGLVLLAVWVRSRRWRIA